MKQTIVILSLLLLPASQIEAQRWRPPHPPLPSHRIRTHYRHNQHSNDYLLNNRIFFKWSPSSLTPTYGASIRVGAEYCFSERYGLVLEGGALLPYGSAFASGYSIRAAGGMGIWPEARVYFGLRSHGRAFAGVQGMYRHETMSAGTGPLYEHNANGYRQTGGTKSVTGAAAQVGFVVHITGPLHFELAGGIGGKNITVARENYAPIPYSGGSSPHDYSYVHTEEHIIKEGSLPYVFASFKLSWLIGQPAGERKQYHK